MLKSVTYMGRTYRQAQQQPLWKRLIADGWCVVIGGFTSGNWNCDATHCGHPGSFIRGGKSLWDCLSQAVVEIKPQENRTEQNK